MPQSLSQEKLVQCLTQPWRSSSSIPIALTEVPDKKEARDAI